jgi:hypothetical protein
MIFQFVWTRGGDDSFEQSVPVLWHGEYLRRHNWDNPITLCFMQGFELLSNIYRKNLVDVGYEIINVASLVSTLTERYPRSRELSTTSRYWLFRWNILKSLAEDRSAQTVIHLDGDLVLLADPNQLYQEVAGKTFMLQGCPAFTAISDPAWFTAWEEELSRFFLDRPAYISAAMEEKANPHRKSREFCNLCAYGPNRFEDQDILEYLVAAAKLPQEMSSRVYDSDYFWIQNPLHPGEWHHEQVGGASRKIIEKGDIAYVGDKRVAFYHFQSDFAKYCRTWQYFYLLGFENLAARLRPTGHARQHSRMMATAGALLDQINRSVSRKKVYEAVFKRNVNTGNKYITDIVNSCWD